MRLDLPGAEVEAGRDGVRVSGLQGTLFCPSDPGADLRLFVAIAENKTRVQHDAWHPGPDPRVAHLYD